MEEIKEERKKGREKRQAAKRNICIKRYLIE
jgi:hypothetical protein